jgi:hypothetical protein
MKRIVIGVYESSKLRMIEKFDFNPVVESAAQT